MKKFLNGAMLALKSRETGRFLVIQELQSKKGIKREGQLSFPAETIFLGESKESALGRVFGEEVGIDPPKENPEFIGKVPWIDRSDLRAEVFVYLAYCDEEFIARPKDSTDVTFHGWMFLDEIISQDIRLGILETIMFLKKKKKNI
ncbi:MAG: NUDIX hydrolase [Candidatus Moraniibacteriota bacterium]|nr:MAG: NUDIX hydrolase [Candidatus Moranbacteria bacterium]